MEFSKIHTFKAVAGGLVGQIGHESIHNCGCGKNEIVCRHSLPAHGIQKGKSGKIMQRLGNAGYDKRRNDENDKWLAYLIRSFIKLPDEDKIECSVNYQYERKVHGVCVHERILHIRCSAA